MKCKISGPNVKILARAVIYLSKISAEVNIEADEGGLCLNTVNTSKTAFAKVKFSVDFFLDFDDSCQEDSDEECRVCKIAVKSILPMFKSLLANPPEMGIISLAPGATTIVFQFKCKLKVTKTYTVAVLDFTRDMVPVVSDDFANNVTGSHKVFNNIVGSFHKSTHELALNITRASINIRNYIDDPEDRMCIRSCYELSTTEFETFAIKSEGTLGFSYSDFRAFVLFADQCEVNVRMVFDGAGQPIQLSFKSSSGLYTASLFAATILEDDIGSTQSSVAYTASTNATTQKSQAVATVSGVSNDNDFNFLGRRSRKRIASVEEEEPSQNNVVPPPVVPDIPKDLSVIQEEASPVQISVPPVVPPAPQHSESVFTSSDYYETNKSNKQAIDDCISAIPKSLEISDSIFRIPIQTPPNTRNQILATDRESIPPTPDPATPGSSSVMNQMSSDVVFMTVHSEFRKTFGQNHSVSLNHRESAGEPFNENHDEIASCPDSTRIVTKRKAIFRRCFDSDSLVPVQVSVDTREILAPDSDED